MAVGRRHAYPREGERTDSGSGSGSDDTRASRQRKQCGGSHEPTGGDGHKDTRKKPTYNARKQEKVSLNEEILLLETRLEQLKMKVGLPTDKQTKSLANLQASNTDMEEAIHANLLSMARFQSLLAHHLLLTPVDPISTFIHLKRDVVERRATLRALRDVKLRRAKELVDERLGGLDPLKPYMADERFLTHQNVYRCKRADIHQFRGLAGGAKQLFDALLYFVSHMEIRITEMLGQLPIREDIDAIEPTLWNHRLVSTTGAGYVQELNTAGFAHFVADHGGEQQTSYGVIAADAVDVDDLYPYTPSKHVRKDVTASITVTEVPADPLAVQGGDVVVVLKRCVFVTIHTPTFALPTSVMDEVVANVSTWSTVMAKYLYDTVTPHGG